MQKKKVRLRKFFFIYSCLLFLFIAQPAATEIVEATVARVGQQVIFLSDLKVDWRINQVLQGKIKAASKKDIATEQIEKLLQWKVKQLVILSYLDQVGLWMESSEKDLAGLTKIFSDYFSSADSYQQFLKDKQITAKRLQQHLWQRRRVELYNQRQQKLKENNKLKGEEDWAIKSRSRITVEFLPWKKKAAQKND